MMSCVVWMVNAAQKFCRAVRLLIDNQPIEFFYTNPALSEEILTYGSDDVIFSFLSIVLNLSITKSVVKGA